MVLKNHYNFLGLKFFKRVTNFLKNKLNIFLSNIKEVSLFP